MNRRKRAALIFGVLALGWIGVLFYFSGQTGAESGELSLKIATKLLECFPAINISLNDFHLILRKLAHGGIFAVQGIFTGLCLMNALRPDSGSAWAAIVCFIMAAANEYHQTFIDGRSGEVRDVLIDSVGALAGIGVAALLLILPRRRKTHKRHIIQDR